MAYKSERQTKATILIGSHTYTHTQMLPCESHFYCSMQQVMNALPGDAFTLLSFFPSPLDRPFHMQKEFKINNKCIITDIVLKIRKLKGWTTTTATTLSATTTKTTTSTAPLQCYNLKTTMQ